MPFLRAVALLATLSISAVAQTPAAARADPSDSSGRTPIMFADLLPIDKAVELMTKLIKESGKVPKQATRR